MTTIDSVQNPTMGLIHLNGLTPDGLVLYLQSQLGDIDAKVDQYMVKQKTIQDQRKELNAMATILTGVEVPTLKEGKSDKYHTTEMDAVQVAKFEASLDTLKIQFPLDKATTTAIEEAKATKFESPEELKRLQSAVDDAIQQLESSASLDMIQLQSCVSQRNTCISLATNLMSAVGKGEESIVGNIGR